MKRIRTLLPAVLSAAVLLAAALAPAPSSAQALAAEPIDGIVAVVEEDVILRSELDRAVGNILNQYRGRTDLPPRDVLEKQVLERLVLMNLQLQNAKRTGIRVSDAELDQAVARLAQQNGITMDQLRQQLAMDRVPYAEFRNSLRDEMIAQRLRQRVVQSRVAVSDTEIDILLASNSLKQGQVLVGHILVALPDGATAEQLATAQTKIDGIKKLIDEGLDFSAAAIRYSDAPNALDGGMLPWRGYDEVPALFANQLQGMQPGDISPPLRGPSGFHLIKLVEKRDPGKQTVTEYKARGILVRSNELVTVEQARERIDQARARVLAGEDFADVAVEVSEDTLTRSAGGDMGWFQTMAYGSAVGEQIQKLADGEVSQPFRSDAGWHIVLREESREQDVTEELLREQARETIARRKSEEEWERFLRQARAESFVETRLGA
jgi:peptidyl-prolyl cis-trans isomerase SurA